MRMGGREAEYPHNLNLVHTQIEVGSTPVFRNQVGGRMIYIVKSGDTLSAIARDHLGGSSRWPEIARLNSLSNPDLIFPGQQLTLPSAGGGILSRLMGLFR